MYYVIAESESGQDYITLLKATPLTVDEINLYGESIGGSTYTHNNKYGGVPYGAPSYSTSNVEKVVAEWSADKFKNNELKLVDGYTARLITYDELVDALKCTSNECSNSPYTWTYSADYWYWTMTGYGEGLWRVRRTGLIQGVYGCCGGENATVRPVINVYKSALK